MVKIFIFLLLFSEIVGAQSTANRYFMVTDFGAKGDGTTKDTEACQRAIDACALKGGGTVVFQAGTYLCGSLHLKSHVALRFDHAAVLKMSPDEKDFDPYEALDFKNAADKETGFFHNALIWGENVEDIAITGTGLIDCNRTKRRGPKPISLKLCRFVKIKDITIKNAPNYNISMIGTDEVHISGVTILNGFADGIDPDGCQNVVISDCNIDCFDDAIVPKASFSLGYLRPVENLTVTNCILASNCNAFKFGTETGGNFKNITFSNSIIYQRKTGRFDGGSGIALESVDGAEIEGVTISNIAIRGINTPIFIRLGNRGRDMAVPKPGYLRDVLISNVVVEHALQPCMILGIPGYPVENVSLSNLKISYAGGGSWKGDLSEFPEKEKEYPDADMFGEKLPAYGFFCRHVQNLSMQDVVLKTEMPDKRPSLVAVDVNGLDMYRYRVPALQSGIAAVQLSGVKKATFRACEIPQNKRAYFSFSDDKNQKREISIVK